MPERIMATDGNDGDVRPHGGDERRCRCLAKAMAADLENVCVKIDPAREQPTAAISA
jgi:hypothetical protein